MKTFINIFSILLLIGASANADQEKTKTATHRFIVMAADTSGDHVYVSLCSDANNKQMKCILHRKLNAFEYDKFKDNLIDKMSRHELGSSYAKISSIAIAGIAGAAVGALTYAGAFTATILSIPGSGGVGTVPIAVISFTEATALTGAATYGSYKGSRYILEKALINRFDLPQEVPQALYELRWSKRVLTIQTSSFQNNPILQLLTK